MKLKKILPELVQTIVEAGYDKEPKEVQTKALPVIKSGADLLVIAPDAAGKSTIVNIGVIQQLKKPEGKAPRAIIITQSKEKAFSMDEQFEKLAEFTGLRSLLVYDEGHLRYQKDMIYEGIDVLITTPKRLNDLINNSGVPLVSLKMLVVDDADQLFVGANHTVVHRIVDSIDKLQILVFASKRVNKLNELEQRVMKNPTVLEVKA